MSLKEKINSVREFHDSFGIKNNSKYEVSLEMADYELRYRLLKEELEEYHDACKDGDIVEIADALGDQLYIIFGTLLKHGLHDKIDQVFDEIQRSNMSKLGEDDKPIYREDGKVLKGPNYFKPDIKKILFED